MDPSLPKAVWGFNGTERPGAVYLAAVLAAHAQKGVPAFGIYGRDVQDADDTTIPGDVRDKILAFVRAAVAAATMKDTSYLAMGGVSMGIGGSIVDPGFLESYLGMRYEMVDMTEFVRRIEEEIYDADELARAREWAAEFCRTGPDTNPEPQQLSAERHAGDWDYCLKMALIGRDLMVGNPRLAELGYGEEALGHNALAAGFQGQRQWTDHLPNGDLLETLLNTSFDWNTAAADQPPAHRAHQSDLADHLVHPDSDRFRSVHRHLYRDGQLGRQPLRDHRRPCRQRPHYPRLDAAHPGVHAQRRRAAGIPAARLEPVRSRGRLRQRLPRLRQIRPAVPLIHSRRASGRSACTFHGWSATQSNHARSSEHGCPQSLANHGACSLAPAKLRLLADRPTPRPTPVRTDRRPPAGSAAGRERARR